MGAVFVCGPLLIIRIKLEDQPQIFIENASSRTMHCSKSWSLEWPPGLGNGHWHPNMHRLLLCLFEDGLHCVNVHRSPGGLEWPRGRTRICTSQGININVLNILVDQKILDQEQTRGYRSTTADLEYQVFYRRCHRALC